MRTMTRDRHDNGAPARQANAASPAQAQRATTHDPDREAVLAAQTDPAAFDTLYEQYFDAIFRYCRYRSDHVTDAEDAASVIFSRALGALPRFNAAGEGTFRAWLFSIAHNTLAKMYRDRRPTRPLDDVSAACDPGRSPEDAAVAADEAATLHRLLRELPPDQRRVVELRLAGLTGPEIASVIGRSHGSVKMLQLRAFKHLRPRLKPPDDAQEDRDATP